MSQTKFYEQLTLNNVRPNLPEQLPSPLQAAIRAGWSTNMSERPTAEAMLAVIDEFACLDRSLVGGLPPPGVPPFSGGDGDSAAQDVGDVV
jgi:hypothetical protein